MDISNMTSTVQEAFAEASANRSKTKTIPKLVSFTFGKLFQKKVTAYLDTYMKM